VNDPERAVRAPYRTDFAGFLRCAVAHRGLELRARHHGLFSALDGQNVRICPHMSPSMLEVTGTALLKSHDLDTIAR
jgi:hypothetical protein